jgi:3-keto-disaccharide hydrolase
VKMKVALAAAVVVLALAGFCVPLHTQATGAAGSSADAASIKPLLGRWDLTLKAPDRDYPSWIEIAEKDGHPTARFVSRWGNARRLPRIEIRGAHITFVSPKEEEDRKDDMVFEGDLTGETLSGTTTGPDGAQWTWTGVRAPMLDRGKAPQWGKPIRLFNGRDLQGWEMSHPGPPEWTVKDGNLVSPGNGPELINNQKFQDFKLHIEFNCGKDANSGVYLRGRYETQIETESQSEPPSHHTGGIYGFIAPSPEQPRRPDVWQAFDITLIGRRVTVVQNGKTIIDNQEIPGITGGALDSNEASPGPLYMQGGEKGHVLFRNIVITPAK